jgi:hypothetical protein
MGFIEQDEDEKQTVPPKPAVPTVQDYIREKYLKAAADTAAVDEAKQAADRASLASGLGRALSTALVGRNKTDSGAYDAIAQYGQAGLSAAQEAHKQGMAKVLQEGELEDRFTTNQRNAEKHKWLKNDEDPGADKAAATRRMLAKRLGVPESTFAGYGYKDALEAAKFIENQRQAQGTEKGRFQMRPLTHKATGVVTPVMFDTASDLPPKGPDGKPVNLADYTWGYVNGYDSDLGVTFNRSNPGSPGVAHQTPAGVDFADAKVEQRQKESYAGKIGTEQATAEVGIAGAEAAGERGAAYTGKWAGMYDAADKEASFTGVGPAAGRVGKIANSVGISTGPMSTKLRTELDQERNKILRELSGAAVTDTEQARILAEFPDSAMDREMFLSRLQSVRDKADRAIAEARAKRAKIGKPPGDIPAQDERADVPGASVVAPATEWEASKLPKLREKYPGRTDEELLKALREKLSKPTK